MFTRGGRTRFFFSNTLSDMALPPVWSGSRRGSGSLPVLLSRAHPEGFPNLLEIRVAREVAHELLERHVAPADRARDQQRQRAVGLVALEILPDLAQALERVLAGRDRPRRGRGRRRGGAGLCHAPF